MPTATALTSDFQVNTYTQGNQHHAEVIVGDDGNFVITWRSEGQDGDEGGIYARRFDSSGAALGDELLVNALTAGDQSDPDIAARPDGAFVVAWASQAGAGGIHSRRFEADGTPLDVEARLRSATSERPRSTIRSWCAIRQVILSSSGPKRSETRRLIRASTPRPFDANGTPRQRRDPGPTIDGSTLRKILTL